jgi:hypothetical protein
MKIKLLSDLPVNRACGMTKGRVLDAIVDEDASRRNDVRYWVKGDNGDKVGVLTHEADKVPDSEADTKPTDEIPHAVRWAQGRLKRAMGEIQWTKWHWTENGNMTLCHYPVVLFGADDVPFPETIDGDEGGVEIVKSQRGCVNCRRILIKKEKQDHG